MCPWAVNAGSEPGISVGITDSRWQVWCGGCVQDRGSLRELSIYFLFRFLVTDSSYVTKSLLQLFENIFLRI